MERLQQLLRAIDTYEVGYVIERDLMQYVFAEDLEAEDYDDVIILNVLLNNYFMQVVFSKSGRIFVGEMELLAFGQQTDLAPTFILLENEAFDEMKFEQYVASFANEVLKRIIYPNYLALKQFVHQQAAAIGLTLEEIVEIWKLEAKGIVEELPLQFDIADNLFLYFLKRSVAGELTGNLAQGGIEFEMEGQQFNLVLDKMKKTFILTKKSCS